ncbi:MAG: hypothetical protein ACRELG_18390, partial [Gemmataceae bacterium]
MATDDLLRVALIRVDGLFGEYSYEVPLHSSERVTIIHGRNGVGKTVLLRLTWALLSGKLSEIADVPFSSFEVELSDRSVYGIRREPQGGSQATTVFFREAGGGEKTFQLEPKGEITSLAAELERSIPWLIRINPEHFLDQRTEEILGAHEVVATYSDFRRPLHATRQEPLQQPDWIKNIQLRVGVHLIETQRLLRVPMIARDRMIAGNTRQWSFRETVRENAKDLQGQMSSALADYAKLSQSLDRSFPNRLLGIWNKQALTVAALRNRMDELEAQRKKLISTGLIEEEDAGRPAIATLSDERAAEAQRLPMTLYVDDTAKKLGALDGFAKRLELMRENINGKFKDKEIRINKEKGIEAVRDDGGEISLAALSSG